MPLTDHMPTAGRLVAAIGLGALGWYGSELFRPLMPEDTNFGWFNVVNVVLGAICGWRVTGKRLGFGYAEGFSAGLTGVGALVFWALFLQSLNEMLKRALDTRYDGVVEGVISMFELIVEYGSLMINGPLIGLLVTGGIVVGIVSEWVSHRWS
ncbi:TrgA family protein [Roseovarius sp. 217]|uniref:TrgA family protein n=1 Tax=Roseovarius sp. (strain 217) TaxID=314264 RepID=UPI00006858C6|nr:TrgA family protein [Roseovarius sp. 217]EAQ26783.1 tellurite resistance protein [Roseovarius sp. 217]